MYGPSTGHASVCLNETKSSCRAEGLGRPRGTPSKALEKFGYRAARSEPKMNYFVFFVMNSIVKYPKNYPENRPDRHFFRRLDFDPLEVP
jgi:hypothetical protein